MPHTVLDMHAMCTRALALLAVRDGATSNYMYHFRLGSSLNLLWWWQLVEHVTRYTHAAAKAGHVSKNPPGAAVSGMLD
jgi:hypothetical protein